MSSVSEPFTAAHIIPCIITMLYCNSHGILAWAVTKSSMSGYRKWGSRSGHDDQSRRLGECGIHMSNFGWTITPTGRCQQSISIIIKTRSMWQQVEI